MMQSEKQKMLSGELYQALKDPILREERNYTQELLAQFNRETVVEGDNSPLLTWLLGRIGSNTIIRSPFYCDYGQNIQIGEDCFVNFNCVFLDCALIEIGNFVQIGPAVQMYTATHPVSPEQRKAGWEQALPITIHDNVWIGGGAIILPGVTIGENSVIGAGSVVTRDVPADTVIAGNPARILKHLK